MKPSSVSNCESWTYLPSIFFHKTTVQVFSRVVWQPRAMASPARSGRHAVDRTRLRDQGRSQAFLGGNIPGRHTPFGREAGDGIGSRKDLSAREESDLIDEAVVGFQRFVPQSRPRGDVPELHFAAGRNGEGLAIGAVGQALQVMPVHVQEALESSPFPEGFQKAAAGLEGVRLAHGLDRQQEREVVLPGLFGAGQDGELPRNRDFRLLLGLAPQLLLDLLLIPGLLLGVEGSRGRVVGLLGRFPGVGPQDEEEDRQQERKRQPAEEGVPLSPLLPASLLGLEGGLPRGGHGGERSWPSLT